MEAEIAGAWTRLLPGFAGQRKRADPLADQFRERLQNRFWRHAAQVQRQCARRPKIALAVGTDLRLPTGDEKNFLGTGALAVKPYAALSLYTKPFENGIVFSPHVNVGWQFAGKSILGGGITGATPVTLANGATGLGAPFTTNKDYLPDIFSWAVGTEVAFGRHNTVVVDILGNQIGWIHGIQNMTNGSIANVPLPQTSKHNSAAGNCFWPG